MVAMEEAAFTKKSILFISTLDFKEETSKVLHLVY